jgi:hypothetical protein
MTDRQDPKILGPDVASQGDEQLVSRFSGRLDDRVGRFVGRPQDDRWLWDQKLLAILRYPGPAGLVTLQTLLEHVVADERELAADAFMAAVEHGQPVDVSCRLHAADGTLRSVLITAEVMEDEPSELSKATSSDLEELSGGSGPWLAGLLIDLTELRLSATRAATEHAVTEALRHRAVIEQAKGIVMVVYRVDADTAFHLLRRHSQNSNTKLHELAARLVAQLSDLTFDPVPAHIDTLLNSPTSR